MAYRGGRHQQARTPTMVVACRYWYEMTDGYWGQFMLRQVPHQYPQDLLPVGRHLTSMANFAGLLEYVASWIWRDEGVVVSGSGFLRHRRCRRGHRLTRAGARGGATRGAKLPSCVTLLLVVSSHGLFTASVMALLDSLAMLVPMALDTNSCKVALWRMASAMALQVSLSMVVPSH